MIELHAMARALERLAGDRDGTVETSLPGLTVMRQREAGRIRHEVYTPVLCLIVQGAKEVALRGDVVVVGAGQALLVSVEVPVSARVQASDARPYLAVAVDLDLALCDELAAYADGPAAAADRAIALIDRPGERLLDCLDRAVALAARPHEAGVLLPGLLRELHFLLLLSDLGAALRAMARPDGNHRRIGRAITLLRSAFHQPLPIETLARAAGMGLSAFHHHFRTVTRLSPRQYQKQLRLLEARRLMRLEGVSAREAAFRVGYASAQQFTRDHARRFGSPPRRGLDAEPDPTGAAE